VVVEAWMTTLRTPQAVARWKKNVSIARHTSMQLQDHSVCCIPHFLVGGCVGFLLIVTAIATGIDIWRNDCNKTKQRKRKQSKAKKTNVP
jgi:hypothetical protein